MVIGKNPSTASASRSDPTLGKVEAWARRRGFGRLALVNLFALRSPYPRDLNAMPYGEAVGEENDVFIREAARRADCLIAAWGDPNGVDEGRYARRIGEAAALLKGREVGRVGMTKMGHPLHGLGWNEGRIRFSPFSREEAGEGKASGRSCPHSIPPPGGEGAGLPGGGGKIPLRAGAPPRRGRR